MNIWGRVILGAIGFVVGCAINNFINGEVQPGCWIGLVIGFFIDLLANVFDDVGDHDWNDWND